MADRVMPFLTRQNSGRRSSIAPPPRHASRTRGAADAIVADSGDLGERPRLREPLPTPIEKPILLLQQPVTPTYRTSAFCENLSMDEPLAPPVVSHSNADKLLKIAEARLKIRAACKMLIPLIDQDAFGPRTSDQIETALTALCEAIRCLPDTALRPLRPEETDGMVYQYESER